MWWGSWKNTNVIPSSSFCSKTPSGVQSILAHPLLQPCWTVPCSFLTPGISKFCFCSLESYSSLLSPPNVVFTSISQVNFNSPLVSSDLFSQLHLHDSSGHSLCTTTQPDAKELEVSWGQIYTLVTAEWPVPSTLPDTIDIWIQDCLGAFGRCLLLLILIPFLFKIN